uniref:G-protein coupled receptors family 1 profile domain-containing protein n=1 Tax=Biomphalaria glabrata TaxID=6526 RepID=A0A2C9L841_BIOGL
MNVLDSSLKREFMMNISVASYDIDVIVGDDVDIMLSDTVRNWFILINHVAINTLICLFGAVGNCLSFAVFLRQGLRKSMNLSLFSISVSDFLGLVLQIWHNFCLNPYVGQIESPLDFMQIQYLTAGWPNVTAVRITGWTTAFMTLERCLSIAIPLKIKQFITFRRSVFIIIMIYVLNVTALSPLYLSAYFSWYNSPSYNHTKLGVSFRDNKLEMQGLVFIFHASLSITSFLLVVIFTAILVLKLKQKSKWRKEATHDNNQNEAISNRERKTVMLTIAVAVVLIVCYTPAVVGSITTAITPDFAITGKQANVFHAVFSFAFVLHSINSSINVAVYYKMSSRYRQTFQKLFLARRRKNDDQLEKNNSLLKF